jgi:ubiquinone/menaquinone biosynthesis C-methylase UbiE
MKKQRKKVFSNIISEISNRLVGEICLEIGCGTGRYIIPISAYCKNKIKIVGIDILHPLRSNKLEFDYVVGDVHKLPFPNNSIPSIYMVQSLHQFTDWHSAITEVKRVQKIGGYLLIHTLSHEQLKQVIILNIVPEALDIELTRFPKIDDIITYCESIGYRLIEEKKINNLKPYNRNDLQEFLETCANSVLEKLFKKLGPEEYNKLVNNALERLGNEKSFIEPHNSTLITFTNTNYSK